MSLNEKTSDSSEEESSSLARWLPALAPSLKNHWAGGLKDLPPSLSPQLADWLALLHVAASCPWKIPPYLAQLLRRPKSSAEVQNAWLVLARLFSLTFEVVQTELKPEDPGLWRDLLEAQNCILKAAATGLAREHRPTTDILTRRSLYLQIAADLHRRVVATTEPNELLDGATMLIQQNLGYDYVNLFLLNQGRQMLTLQSAFWKNQFPRLEENIALKLTDPGIVNRAAATGQVVLVNDTSQHPGFRPHPAMPRPQAQLAVPLMVGNNLIGVLDVESDRADFFTEDDRQLLQALADHIAFAIENARLQTALQRHLREKNLLYESNVALGPTLEVDTVLKLMTQKFAEALDVGACVICMTDEKANTITAVAEYVRRYPGNPPRTWRKLNVPFHLTQDPIARQVLKAGRPVVTRAGADPNIRELWQLPAGQTGQKAVWHVVLALPLEAEKRVMGLLEIYDKNPGRNFAPDDIQLCRILATQTTLALERARLFDETRQRLAEVTALYTMAQKISGNLDLQEVLNTMVVALRQVMGCRGCCIFLLDESGENLEIAAADGLKPHWRKMAKLRLGEGAAGQAAAEKRTIYLPDTHQEPGFIFFDEEVRSLMVIPLVVQGKVIGTINVDDSQSNAFGTTEERLLAIAAAQASIAIDNARLFAKVSAEQQQMQAIVQYMADGLLLINAKGAIATCNPALAMMLDMHPGQIIGQSIQAPDLHPNLVAVTATPTHQARTGVLATEVTIKMPHPRTLQIFSTRMVDSNQNPLGEVRVVHDVTREREFEALKNDFMSTVSHELRTPLFSIQGFVQLMQEDENLNPETRTEFLNIIQHQASQLGEMVNNLLDLSRFDEGRLEFERKPVGMLDLIHRTVLKLQGFAHRQQVNLITQLPSFLPLLLGDPQRLEQVLTNLIGNAIKFTNPGGQVVVLASVNGDKMLVEVKDNGIGIPEAALERIFSRYYQVEDRSERSAMGSGLGLHIAQKIVEGHGGQIWAESLAGEGSTFRFTLPLPEE